MVGFPETAVWPSGEEKKEKTLVSSSKALTRFTSLYAIYSKVDVACLRNGVLDYSLILANSQYAHKYTQLTPVLPLPVSAAYKDLRRRRQA